MKTYIGQFSGVYLQGYVTCKANSKRQAVARMKSLLKNEEFFDEKTLCQVEEIQEKASILWNGDY